MGYVGEDPVHTPRLDTFAAESLDLTHATSTCPLCTPYRGMLMTGRYPFSTGIVTNCSDSANSVGVELGRDERCFGDVLHDVGYACGYVGKWHLDQPHEPYIDDPRAPRGEDETVWDEWTPPDRGHGFDFWYAYGSYNEHLRLHDWADDTPRETPLLIEQWSPEHEADVVIDYLRNFNGRREGGQPFAMFWSLNPPHPPFAQVPERYREPYRDLPVEVLLNRPNVDLHDPSPEVDRARRVVADYFAAVTGVDDQVGRVLDALEAAGLRDDTSVVFTSDHGEMLGSHDRLGKSVAYAQSFHVPMLIRWPGRVTPGEDNLLLDTPDLMPTLLALLGLSDAVPDAVQGRDLSAAMLGRPCDRPDHALYLLPKPVDPAFAGRGLRTNRHTLWLQPEASRLFDNVNDPYQRHNLFDEEPALARDLCNRLDHHLARLTASSIDAGTDSSPPTPPAHHRHA